MLKSIEKRFNFTVNTRKWQISMIFVTMIPIRRWKTSNEFPLRQTFSFQKVNHFAWVRRKIYRWNAEFMKSKQKSCNSLNCNVSKVIVTVCYAFQIETTKYMRQNNEKKQWRSECNVSVETSRCQFVKFVMVAYKKQLIKKKDGFPTFFVEASNSSVFTILQASSCFIFRLTTHFMCAHTWKWLWSEQSKACICEFNAAMIKMILRESKQTEREREIEKKKMYTNKQIESREMFAFEFCKDREWWLDGESSIQT